MVSVDTQKGVVSTWMTVLILSLITLMIVGFAIVSSPEAVQWLSRVANGDVQKEEVTLWRGELKCGPVGNHSAFSKTRDVTLSDGSVLMEYGQVEEFYELTDNGTKIPRRTELRFEWWEGSVTGKTFEASGWYAEGQDFVKRIKWRGTVTDSDLQLVGSRGPRNCEFNAKPVSVLVQTKSDAGVIDK